MANKIILLGSVLKPIDDTRMYEKIGLSVSKIEKAEIHIAGYESINKPPKAEKIQFHPLFNFPRLSLKRVFAGWKFFRLMLKVSPKLTIVNTHELLIVTVLYQILFGSKIIYDVQENYFKNLMYGKQYTWPINILLALYIRVIEVCTYPFIDKYLLAEICYFDEMSFLQNKAIIIENKVLQPTDIHKGSITLKAQKKLKLIYTGTIAKAYGIFEAIQLAKAILTNIPGEFIIIGHAHDRGTFKAINRLVKEDAQIHLVGGDKLVPHSQILEAILNSDFALVSYKQNKATSGRIPTRFYEYMAYKLPFVYPDNPVWINLCSKYPAGISVDYNNFDPSVIFEKIMKTTFYQIEPGLEISWANEEKKLVSIINERLG